jgi:hypothetical protein
MHSLANHIPEISVTYTRSMISLADECIRNIRDIRVGCIKISILLIHLMCHYSFGIISFTELLRNYRIIMNYYMIPLLRKCGRIADARIPN